MWETGNLSKGGETQTRFLRKSGQFMEQNKNRFRSPSPENFENAMQVYGTSSQTNIAQTIPTSLDYTRNWKQQQSSNTLNQPNLKEMLI